MSHLQDLLNQECKMANEGKGDSDFRTIILAEIRQLRGTEPPYCFGEDDCSTIMLSQCPWRMDCGS